jgi:hypothetical protein
MAFRWKVIAVSVENAQDKGTGSYEPFGVATDVMGYSLVLCKQLVEEDEDPNTSKATEVTGGLGKDW